jgi:hypothetical protein
MNDHAFGGRDAPVGRDGHVDKGRMAIGEAIEFRGGLMAQLSSGAGREHGRPQLRVPGHRAGEGRVDAGVDASPAAESDPGDDSAIGHSGPKRLPARHHACLVAGEAAQSLRYYVPHSHEYGYRHRQSILCGPLKPSAHVITKDLCTYTTIILRHDERLRDHGGEWGREW